MTQKGAEVQQEGVVEQASAKVSDAASSAQEKAGELTAEGKSRLAAQLDQRTTDAGSQARSMAESLRKSTEQMRSDGNSGAASVAEQAASQIERLGSYLEQRSGDDVIRDAESLARRRPWLIAGLGLAGGLAAARFVKASSERRYASREPARRLPQVTAAGYVGTSAYGSPYSTAGSGFDGGTAPIARDPAGVEPFVDRPLGPEG